MDGLGALSEETRERVAFSMQNQLMDQIQQNQLVFSMKDELDRQCFAQAHGADPWTAAKFAVWCSEKDYLTLDKAWEDYNK